MAGLCHTFDGEHPCPVCKVIQEGKKQEEKKAPLLNTELKKEYLATCHHFQIYQDWVEVKYLETAEHLRDFGKKAGYKIVEVRKEIASGQSRSAPNARSSWRWRRPARST